MQNLFGEKVPDPIVPNSALSSQSSALPRDPAPFTLTDHIFVSDRKGAWLRYRALINDGYDIDGDLVPAIWWCLRTTLAVLVGDTADIKPFVLGKAKKLGQLWGKSVCYDQCFGFLELIIHSRSPGGLPIEYSLEKWILSLPSK